MATRVLYMEERRGQDPDPCYAREFDARIVERGPDFVVLDQTLFYAEGGGQPDDTGSLQWTDGEARVLRVTKEKGIIKQHVDRMPSADSVHGVIDWDRRYKHMRMHTSQHLMSGLVFRTYAARTVGNQIHMDYSRVDFQPANFTADDLKRIEDECNGVVASAQDVRIFEEDRAVVHNKIEDRALLELIPQSVRRLRIIQIGNADYCPCGGTHLKNVSEIGRVRILEKRSKGKQTDRIVYELLPGYPSGRIGHPGSECLSTPNPLDSPNHEGRHRRGRAGRRPNRVRSRAGRPLGRTRPRLATVQVDSGGPPPVAFREGLRDRPG